MPKQLRRLKFLSFSSNNYRDLLFALFAGKVPVYRSNRRYIAAISSIIKVASVYIYIYVYLSI